MLTNKKRISNNSEKYLILMQPEEKFPPMLNTQRFTFMEIILLCKKTNRIFVLPEILSQPRDNKIAESGETNHKKFVLGEIFIPMGHFFNIELLNNYVKTISFKDFIKISKNHISKLYCFDHHFSNKVNIYNHTFYCDKTLNPKNLKDVFNNDEPFIAISGYKPGKYLVKSFPSWPKNFKKKYWEITKHIQYNKSLIQKAEKFIEKNNLKNYLAIHWRRGDRVHPEVSELAEQIISDESEMKKRIDLFLIKPALKIMKKYKLNKVFLATNSGTKWHLEYLKSKLPIVQYPASGKWKYREEEGIIEQILCIKSDYFFAAPFHYEQCSNFSRWIIDFRIISGKGKMISHQLKMQSSVVLARMHLIKEKILLRIRPLLKKILPIKLQKIFTPIYVWLKSK